MHKRVYEISNYFLSEGNEDKEMQDANQGMLMQGELTRYLRTLLKPQNVIWNPKLGP